MNEINYVKLGHCGNGNYTRADLLLCFSTYENGALVEIQREQLADGGWRSTRCIIPRTSRKRENRSFSSPVSCFPPGVPCFRFALTGLKLLN